MGGTNAVKWFCDDDGNGTLLTVRPATLCGTFHDVAAKVLPKTLVN
jgi:hypothetical protein